MLEYKHDDWNGVFENINDVQILLQLQLSLGRNFLPNKFVPAKNRTSSVCSFNPFLKASERLASIRSPLQIFTVHFFC